MQLYVVVADDDLEDHNLIKKAIGECDVNHIVTSVYNGEQLLNLLHKRDFYRTSSSRMPDLIVLDLRMPLMDGLEALRRIKSDEALKEIAVYVLTDSYSDASARQALELGAEKIFSKPFDFAELAKIMGNICTESASRRENSHRF